MSNHEKYHRPSSIFADLDVVARARILVLLKHRSKRRKVTAVARNMKRVWRIWRHQAWRDDMRAVKYRERVKRYSLPQA